jgi:hypothetical protein
MTSEVGQEGRLGFKHIPINVGKCKEMNPNIPKKWILNLGIGVLWAFQNFGTRFYISKLVQIGLSLYH